MKRLDLDERINEIKEWINDNWSFSEICRELKCNKGTLHSFLKRNNIQYNGNKGLKGRKNDHKRKTVYEMIEAIKNGVQISNYSLRNRLLEDGLKENKCEICGITEWNNEKVILELHHKDFNHHNTNFENLQLLCSNCHTYVHHYKKII